MMNNLVFLRQEWLLPVIVCTAFLWAAFLWKEYAQSRMRHFFLKGTVAFVAVGSLAAIVLQPMLTEDRTRGIGAILTQNYEERQLDSLKSLYNELSVIEYAGNGFEEAQLDSIGNAFVLGNGVSPYDFWQLKNIATTYVGGHQIKGIARIQYQSEITLGDSLKLRGLYVKPTKGNRLVLEDAGGNGLDSIKSLESENFSFRLRTKPKVAGKFVYKLVEKDSLNRIVSTDPLPVNVRPKSSLHILIINTFPTFETKYLKNFLAQNGHELLIRSQLTKNKYKFESFNRKQGSIYGLTPSNLTDFDIVIIDGDSYLGLPSASKQALEKQIKDKGLGVFIQSDASVVSNGKGFGFRFKRNTASETSLSQWSEVKIPVFPASFEFGPLVQPILSSKQGVWSAYIQKGLGRVSTSMLSDTYQLVLEGNEDTYQYIWSTILSVVSQKNFPIVHWETDNYLAYLDEPFNFKLRTSIPNPRVVDGQNNQMALRQNLQLLDLWEGTVYPNEMGWNRLQLKQDSTLTKHYYVGSSKDWQQTKDFNIKQENTRSFNRNVIVPSVVSTVKPISRLWLFLIFILSMGYLWVAPRMSRE